MTALTEQYVHRFLGMTPFGRQLEQALIDLRPESLLTLINEQLDRSRSWNKWIDAGTHYTLVAEVAKRWHKQEVKLWDRVYALAEIDKTRPPPSTPPSRTMTEPTADPEPALRATGEPKAQRTPTKRTEDGKRRTIKQACAERFAAGDTDAEAWVIVKAEFDLPDSKQSYVKYYRKHGGKKS